MSLTEKMIEGIISKIKPEEKERIIEKVMEKFFEGISKEEKQKIIEKMMHKAIESVDMPEIASQLAERMMREAPAHMQKMCKTHGVDLKHSELSEKIGNAIKEVEKTNKQIIEELRRR